MGSAASGVWFFLICEILSVSFLDSLIGERGVLTLSLELPLLLSESLVGDVGDLENLSEEAEGDLGGAESEGERGGP